jgi:hypothetical protein
MTLFQINFDFIQNNQERNILDIDIKQFGIDFIAQDAFYSALNNAKNLFFVDLLMDDGEAKLNGEVIKANLNTTKRPLIIQCGSPLGTKVYAKVLNVKEPKVLDLNVDSEQFDSNTLIEKLSKKESFGLPLVVNALKSGLIGKFIDEPASPRSLRRVTFDIYKQWNGWKLIDYAAWHDDLLATCFLSLYDWVLTTTNEEGLRALEIAAKHASVETLAALLDVQFSQPPKRVELAENKDNLLNLANKNNGNTPLLIAAKNGKADTVDFFIRCGADINHRNLLKKSAIDLAWEYEHYNSGLALLKADSDFPKKFKLEAGEYCYKAIEGIDYKKG